MGEQFTLTKEKILEAAKRCPAAESTLKILFPKTFEVERKKENWKIMKKEDLCLFLDGPHKDGYFHIHIQDNNAPHCLIAYQNADEIQVEEGNYKIEVASERDHSMACGLLLGGGRGFKIYKSRR